MGLQADLLKIAQRRSQDLEDIFVASFFRLGNQVIQGAVADTGRFRNSFNGAVTAPDLSANRAADRSGSGSRESLKISLDRFDLGATLFFTSSLPYSWRLEYDGWSERMPDGIVRVTARKWDQIVADEVRKRQ